MKLAVIVATHNRCDLLKSRSLPSIVAQSHQPDFLIVCDDSRAEYQKTNEQIVANLKIGSCKKIYIKNKRTAGISGTCNTAIDALLKHISTPEETIVAFLDDDDNWLPTYLERCLKSITSKSLDMVSAGIKRIESDFDDPIKIFPPPTLKQSELLVRNNGIQGSNLFVRLSLLLQAGCFDENLKSTTDRDLCIRITEIKDIKYHPINEILVEHYAETSRQRLSNKKSPEKINGLDQFWLKYSPRMSKKQRDAFQNRAASVFGWKMNTAQTVSIKKYSITPAPKSEPFELIIGVITSDPDTIKPLLSSIKKIKKEKYIKKINIIILDNHSKKEKLQKIINKNEASIIPPEKYQRDAESNYFGSGINPSKTNKKMSISTARTLIQRYLGLALDSRPGAIGWILDDDMYIEKPALEYLAWLPEFKRQGVDVLLGSYEGSSPNPPLNGLRVQLMDFVHNLEWLDNLPPNDVLPDRSNENNAVRSKYIDYYYDLSRKHSGHLETPLWLEPEFPMETVSEAKIRLLDNVEYILSGIPITRRLIAKSPENPIKTAQDSVNRGGNTFILNPESLLKTPNSAPLLQGRDARRSDMIWAIVNKHYRNMNIKAVSFPVQHLGRKQKSHEIKSEKVQEEIIGSSIYAGLTDFLKLNPNHNLKFSNVEIESICEKISNNMNTRIELLYQNFYRINGLCKALKKKEKSHKVKELIRKIENGFSLSEFHQIRRNINSFCRKDISVFLSGLIDNANKYGIPKNEKSNKIKE